MNSRHSGPILAVDDDEEFLAFADMTLRGAGYEVETAPDAAGAGCRLAARDFALILTDLRLPAASGIDLIKEARERSPLAVGIIVSGHGSVEAALEALREGAYDFLLKPCSDKAMLAAVRRALEHHQLKRDLLERTAQLERKSRLLHDVSHELRNPLSVVCGYSTFLLGSKPETLPPQELARNLRSIHHNAERLNMIVEELLESARLTGDKVKLNLRAVDAGRLVAETVSSHALEAAKRDLALRAERLPETPLLVEADYGKAHQILANLVDNALKFTPAGGSVRVSAEADGPQARFTVRDTGPGLPPGDAARIFERFYQSEGEGGAGQGLGLGLEICRGLVELHRGRIWVESRAGQGCAFHFTLPLSSSPQRKLSAPEPG